MLALEGRNKMSMARVTLSFKELTRMEEDDERRLRDQRFLEVCKASALDDVREFCSVAENKGNP